MAHSSVRVTSPTGELLGIFPMDKLADVRQLVQANPGANTEVVTTVDNACSKHPAFEADYCPSCPHSDTNRYVPAAGRY